MDKFSGLDLDILAVVLAAFRLTDLHKPEMRRLEKEMRGMLIRKVHKPKVMPPRSKKRRA